MYVALEGAAMLAVLVVLLVLGVRLMGPTPRTGLRAGLFVGLFLLLVLALIGRWLGGILESWIYEGGWPWSALGLAGSEATVGGILAAVIVELLALWVLRVFFRPGFQRCLGRFEGPRCV